jgi:uncharacterized protein (TIGR03435 family)
VLPGGQYIDPRTPVSVLIEFAYDIRITSGKLIGLPNWGDHETYAIAAKPDLGFPVLPPGKNVQVVREMMRVLLADRFRLQIHEETHQELVYQLSVGRGGIKAKEVPAPIPPAQEGLVGAAVGNAGGHMVGKTSTMNGLASALAVFPKRPVRDETGLKGYYDFNFTWLATDGPGSQPIASGLGPDGISLLISAVRGHLGVNVGTTSGTVKRWIVDHIEHPRAN